MPRVFFGLELNQADKQAINYWRENYLEFSFKPVDIANYHITLVFLGIVNDQQLQQLIDIGNSIVASPFHLDLSELDFWAKPQVLFLKPQVTPSQLEQLFEQLSAAISAQGNELSLQHSTVTYNIYQPHVTLVRKAKYLPEITSDNTNKMINKDAINHPFFRLSFDRFCLFESVSTADGVKYRVLKSWPLVNNT